MIKEIFHTLTFQNNNQEVLDHGPYKCFREDAWLSPGFYFWEESIKAAHYWGTNWVKKDYIIFQACCYIDETNCFDLVGSPKHVDKFRGVYQYLVDNGIATTETTVGHVIDFMRKANSFNYASSRIESTDAFKHYIDDPQEIRELKFDNRLTIVTLKLHLVVQICVFNLEEVLFDDFRLVHDSNQHIIYP